jgi:hypothetical protein
VDIQAKEPRFARAGREAEGGMAGRIIDDFKRQRKPFSIDSFKDRFKRNNNEIGVYEFFDELKEEMRLVGRVNNAMVYYESKRALIRYRSNVNLSFGEIDYIFLKGFEKHLLAEIKSKHGFNSLRIEFENKGSAFFILVKRVFKIR